VKGLEQFDIVIGEVKEGLSAFNLAVIDPNSARERFGSLRQRRRSQADERLDGG
jgi:hypothetical protein